MYKNKAEAVAALKAREQEFTRESAKLFWQLEHPDTEFPGYTDEVMGYAATLETGAEIEFTAVGKSSNPKDFPLKQKDLDAVVKDSPFVLELHNKETLYGEEWFVDHLPDGRYTEHLEYVLHFQRREVPVKHFSNGKLQETGKVLSATPISQVEAARTFEALANAITKRYERYGLTDALLRSDAVPGRENYNATHLHMGMIAWDGTNPFDDGKGFASKLLLCTIEAALDFARDGGMVFYAPSERSFGRLTHSIAGPQAIALRRRVPGQMGAGAIRGANYDVSRPGGKPFEPELQGQVRYEMRLGQAEAVNGEPKGMVGPLGNREFPYIFQEAHVIIHNQGLKNFVKRAQEGTLDELTEESLDRNDPLPRNLDEAIEQFSSSKRMTELFGEERVKAHVEKLLNIREMEARELQVGCGAS